MKNHPWEGGNKRTATFLTNLFLKRNGWRLETSTSEIVELVLAVESGKWQVIEIENWLPPRVRKV
ncbi:MAG: Fic family protein [Acidobacteriota bacterium]|nr:Fic family protein [Acidobacteriota bacterium]